MRLLVMAVLAAISAYLLVYAIEQLDVYINAFKGEESSQYIAYSFAEDVNVLS